MKYLLFDISNMIVHSQSGIAYNTKHIHETRTMSLTEIMLVVDGELYMHHIEDYHLVKNDIFILPQGIKHYGTERSDFQIHWHHFFLPNNTVIVDESELKNYDIIKDMIALPLQIHLKNLETILMLSYQLEQYPWTTDETQMVRNALMTTIILQIALESKNQYQEFHNKRFNSIISYIDNNFQHHPISIKSLAEKFSYNEKYIFRLFKENIGISPLQYIILQKMKEARQMVLNSSDTIESIALSLNYENPQYFMRQFKKIYGITPSEMRRHYSNSLELYLSSEKNQ